MEPIIALVALVVLAVGGILGGRMWAAGDLRRTAQVARAAYSMSIVFAFTWGVGYILGWPLLSSGGIVLAVATAAVAFDAALQVRRRTKK